MFEYTMSYVWWILSKQVLPCQICVNKEVSNSIEQICSLLEVVETVFLQVL